MLVLAIDASSAAVTVGVARVQPAAPVRVIAQRTVIDARAHAELLSSFARECVAEAGADMGDLQAVVGGIGPGPYTGLRVGIVTAAAFADALGIAVYGVCSLDAIGLAAAAPGPVLVAADARRTEVYWARYVGGARLGDPQVHRPAALRELIDSGAAAATAMTGAGARLYADGLGLPLLDVDHPPVGGLVALAAERIAAAAPSEILVPLYLRQPDAEVPTAPAKSTLGPAEPR